MIALVLPPYYMATDPNVVLFYALRSLQSRLDRIVRRLCLVGQTVDVCSAETRKDAWDPRVDVGEFPLRSSQHDARLFKGILDRSDGDTGAVVEADLNHICVILRPSLTSAFDQTVSVILTGRLATSSLQSPSFVTGTLGSSSVIATSNPISVNIFIPAASLGSTSPPIK